MFLLSHFNSVIRKLPKPKACKKKRLAYEIHKKKFVRRADVISLRKVEIVFDDLFHNVPHIDNRGAHTLWWFNGLPHIFLLSQTKWFLCAAKRVSWGDTHSMSEEFSQHIFGIDHGTVIDCIVCIHVQVCEHATLYIRKSYFYENPCVEKLEKNTDNRQKELIGFITFFSSG